MCIEDIAISRRCYAKDTAMSSGVATRLAPNPDRIGVRVIVALGNPTYGAIANSEANANASVGFKVYYAKAGGVQDAIGVFELALDYRDDGPTVMDELWVQVTGASVFVREYIMQTELAADVAKEAAKWNKK